METINGYYPVGSWSPCKACLEPQFCDCLCETCKASREKWYSSEEYRKYLSDILDPRD